MADDWRLVHLKEQPFLQGQSFIRKSYKAYRPGWEHDHCAACWATIAEPGQSDEAACHEGYATTADYVRGADYEWVCVPCFDEFKAVMAWKDVPAG
ncbi:hypothetical protein IC614_07770 [Allosphingosinicella flava]|uniref:Uncharacterized protein n=1 Tax=Allosphingosinicella flava TaxID=2771430 RepID=A0A7T2GI28_9SPHN|nr:hypothetical protein [Sphingosinicella flava]QPQ54260.1 hypothetical protein IC614_07770 [Sphingosinicella flava]